MTSQSDELDNLCKKILLVLPENESLTLSQIQREGDMSYEAAKRHVNHLKELGLVNIQKIRMGNREYYQISLTEKGLVEKQRLSHEK